MYRRIFFYSLMLIVAIYSQTTLGQTVTNVNISESDDAPIISRHIYGHFAEHLGRCIYEGFYVGENSTIPNSAGVRLDIIEALKELQIPNLRWPGGCFADTYHWMDGIGDLEKRPTIVNTWWGGVTEDNSFGTHNFLNLCEELGAEPYLSGNVGSGGVQELADWVQYTNFKGKSPMSDLRRENGRDEPWTVKYWGIGNEAWGCGGNMRPEYYADIYKKYVTFMSDADIEGGLYKIASGASNDDYNWTEVLMKNIPKNMLEGVALHHYSVIDWDAKGPDVDFDEQTYFNTMKESWLMEELIVKHTAIMDKYDEKKEVDLIVDEWGGWYEVAEGTNPGFLYQQNTMRDAMIAGMNLNIFNNHADRVKMANLAQTVNVLQAVILTEEEKMILTPTYHVMNMYKVHQDATLIPLSFDSPKYTLKEESLPALTISASKDEGEKTHISFTNIDANKAHTVSLDLNSLNIKNISGTVLSSDSLQDHNTFENPDKIAPKDFKDFKFKKGKLEVNIPPFSVIVLEGYK
ncbi:alpha-L-arabinofuranosidase C-terminal domain-containing protein [Maribacter sp. PR1]|uniref:non-reducing end alpha-L-arabinofuranosidase n=1 Tax=Maribacter cobaltidurans TaxID=1178778 RepID=A0ABU7INP3_9FLAO|nr:MULTISPECIES: alpha-L-arabinofuranosidase C-terminal domain-containing protein [Maribacter]MDC6387055.1 alpha-L-arabinofuranosidase C-terminal domain-containing protein [Maribacter sp. PR1]MEE1974441.1 alpha-L-arabinofuranosidase C-terminal domain-containing protein [Maribacter cobaltidurans]